MAYRSERVAKIIERKLSEVLLFESKDELLKYVSVTKVNLNKDMSIATVFYTVIGNENEVTATSKALESSKGYLRSMLSKSLDLRKTPDLKFKYDHSLEYGNHIEEILNDVLK